MIKKITPYLLALILLCIIVIIAFPPLNDPLTVELRPSKLVLFNNTADTLQYAAFERKALRSIEWKPCDHPQLCNNLGIKPGLTRELPYEIIYHWYPGAEVIVYWWRLEPDTTAQNGYRIDGPYDVMAATPKKILLGMYNDIVPLRLDDLLLQ